MVQITIHKGKDPQLRVPKFLCDKPLKEGLPKPYDLLVDGYKFVLFTGIPQSGKTSHLFSLFKDKRCLRKVWNNIILVMPQESLRSMDEGSNVFKDIAPDKRYDSIQDIMIIREQIKHYANQGESTCLILDDQMAYLKDGGIAKVLTELVSNRRHLKLSILCLSQLYERCPMKVRKMINVCITMFRPSKREFQMMMDELLEQKEDVANEISKIAFQKKYDWLLIDAQSQRIFSKYDELIIRDE